MGAGYTKLTLWRCDTCLKTHDTAHAAKACAESTDEARFKAGDIVITYPSYGWFDGDSHWIAWGREGSRDYPKVWPPKRLPKVSADITARATVTSPGSVTLAFFYVVTLVDRDTDGGWPNPHRARYHVATLAMSGAHGHRGGYTFNEHHTRLHAVDPRDIPKRVKETAPSLVGWKADSRL